MEKRKQKKSLNPKIDIRTTSRDYTLVFLTPACDMLHYTWPQHADAFQRCRQVIITGQTLWEGSELRTPLHTGDGKKADLMIYHPHPRTDYGVAWCFLDVGFKRPVNSAPKFLQLEH